MGNISLLVLCFLTGVVWTMASVNNTVFDVMKFGAAGDGTTDDCNSFLKAWKAACACPGNPTYLIPSGKTFLIGKTTFEGPCKGYVHVKVLGDIVAPKHMWPSAQKHWIRFHSVDWLTVDGNGTVDGQGSVWWDCKRKGKCKQTPDSMRMERCNKLKMSGLKFVNSPSKHLTVSRSATVTLDAITITATNSSPNTDGLHIEKSQHVRVTNCRIGTGDDCISIGTGTSDLDISGVACGPGHGISIGSLGKGKSKATVQGVRVTNCSFTGTSNGARIKTWQGGSGYVKNVVFKDLRFSAVKHPIIIDQYYCDKAHDCKNQTSAVQVTDVTYSSVRGTGAQATVIDFACSTSHPCTGIVVSDVKLTCTKNGTASSRCINAHGRAQGSVSPPIPCLSGY